MLFISEDLGDSFIEDFAAAGIARLEEMLARWALFQWLYPLPEDS